MSNHLSARIRNFDGLMSSMSMARTAMEAIQLHHTACNEINSMIKPNTFTTRGIGCRILLFCFIIFIFIFEGTAIICSDYDSWKQLNVFEKEWWPWINIWTGLLLDSFLRLKCILLKIAIQTMINKTLCRIIISINIQWIYNSKFNFSRLDSLIFPYELYTSIIWNTQK